MRLLSLWLLVGGLAVGCASSEAEAPDPGGSETAMDGDSLTGAQKAGAVLVTTSNVNLREGPSTGDAVITVIPKGTEIALLGGTPNNGFYQVEHEGQEGWCSGKYLKVSSNPAPKPEPEPTPDPTPEPNPEPGTKTVKLPPVNGGLDYQLGGVYAPPKGVTIVSRDRTASIAQGLYNICYVNGFQGQPGENFSKLYLRDASGDVVMDQEWNEPIFDTRPAKRAALVAQVGAWIDGCADAGFDAVEIDNLDTFSRSGGLLSEQDAVDTIAAFAERAHARGLAIAQKNSAEIVGRKAEMGTDFVVTEQCNTYDECGTYIDAYGDHVLMIEYTKGDFQKGCSSYPNHSIVLRDMNVSPKGSSGYVYQGC